MAQEDTARDAEIVLTQRVADDTGENGRAPLPAERQAGGGADVVRRVGRRRAAGPGRSRLAANDDGPSIGGLIYALNQKPSNRPYLVAAAASAGWGVVSILLGSALLAPEISASAGIGDLLAKPAVLATFATVTIPIVLFWFIAYLAWRAESLRMMSTAMTEVAVRLAEPDRLAEQSIASLGQSVRRQVAAMNDAISRAIGRAGELEALVHGEVGALERSYSENELRIRSLIDELASERDALANNSSRVGETLRGIGAEVSRDIVKASDAAARNLAAAGARISGQLSTQSGEVADLLSEKGNSLFAALSVMNQRIASEVPALLERLGSEQTRLTRIVEGAAKNLTALDSALTDRIGEIETSLGARTGELQSVLGERTERLQGLLSEYSSVIDERITERTQSLARRLQQFEDGFGDTADRMDRALSERSQALDAAIIERTKAIDYAFTERLRAIEDGIASGAESIDRAVAGRADALRTVMESHARTLSDTLKRQASDLDSTLVEGIDAVRRTSETIATQSIQTIGGLSKQSKVLREVSEKLLEQIHELTQRFEAQGRSMLGVVGTLESTQGRLGSDIDARAREIERLRHEAESGGSRVIEDLRARMSSISGELASQLGTLSEATRDIETRSARLPDAVRQNSDAMRRAVEEQIRAIEALSGTAREQRLLRDVSPGEGQSLPSLARGLDREARAQQARGDAARQPQRGPGEATDRVPPSGRARDHRPPAPLPEPPPAGDLGGLRESTWSLGDLLKRASLEDEGGPEPGIEGMAEAPHAHERAPAAAQSALRPLSLADMAQAIDPSTAADLWSRYRNGERTIFSRQIYSRAGLDTFEEIARRLESDPGFGSMAERYLADFERALKEADVRDPSGRLALSQIMGDMGRVYLLFAHATGRIA